MMIVRTVSVALVVSASFSIGGHALAQATRSTLQTYNNKNIFPNSQGLVTPSIVNSMFNQTFNGMGVLGDTNVWTGANTFSGGLTISGGATGPVTLGAPLRDNSAVIAGLPSFFYPSYFGNPGTAIVHTLNRLSVGIPQSFDDPTTAPNWANAYGSENLAQLSSVSSIGGSAVFGASRASDWRNSFGSFTGGTGTIAESTLNDVQDIGNIMCGFCAYNYQSVNNGITLNQFDVNVYGTATQFTPNPYYATVSPTSWGLGITAGAVLGTINPAGALYIGNGIHSNNTFEKGIVFLTGSLDAANGAGGGGVAEEFSDGQSLRWLHQVSSGPPPTTSVDSEIYANASGLFIKGPVTFQQGQTPLALLGLNSNSGLGYLLAPDDLSPQFAWADQPGSVNFWQTTGAQANVAPTLLAQGSDTNVTGNFAAQGTGGFNFGNGSGQLFNILDGGGFVNAFPTVSPAVSFGAPVNYTATAVVGSNIPVALVPIGNAGASLGQSNTTAALGSYAAGRANVVSSTGQGSGALGTANNSGGIGDLVTGTFACDNFVNGKVIFAAGKAGTVCGSAQAAKQVLFATTTGATTATAAVGGSVGAGNIPQLVNNGTHTYQIRITGRDTSTGASASWFVTAQMHQGASIATTTLDGSSGTGAGSFPTGTGASSWSVALAANNSTIGGLLINCTGAAGNTILWVVNVETTEALSG